jgi:hypothetical protein
MFGLISPLGLAVLILYGYVGVAAFRGELKAGAAYTLAATKALSWPATIWSTIDKLYLARD